MIRVNLELGKGDLLTGFDYVNAKLTNQQGELFCHLRGSLPAKPEIQDCYNHWHKLYIFLLDNSRIEMVEKEYVSNFSTGDFLTYCESLKEYINDWFNCQEFSEIKQGLLSETNRNEPIEIILETEDNIIRRLPLHLWDFMEKFRPHCEIAFNKPDWTRRQISKTPFGQVRILGILGDASDITLEKDEEQLNKLQSRARVEPKIEPELTIEKFSHLLWARKGWDLLYFAGHSFRQGNNGVIKLNQNEYLSIKELKNGLQQAIRKGLQIAIFNSCDGLGLAQDLQDLHIPVVIVMREPVPDYVAHEFIKYFLDAFSQNDDVSIYKAMREARERLFETVESQKNQINENKYPCASWLPIMFVNPAVPSPTWKDLRNDSPPINWWNALNRAFVASFICTTLVMGMRSLGLLEGWEFQTYDIMMSQRNLLMPDEGIDDRILIVEGKEDDISQDPDYKDFNAPSNETLTEVIEKINSHQPKYIGLDFTRTFNDPKSSLKRLISLFETNNHLIGSCQILENKKSRYPNENIAFIDLFKDPSPGDILRRISIFSPREEDKECQAATYLGADLAFRYLEDKLGEENVNILIDKKLEPYELTGDDGFYRKFGNWGYEILINYRMSKTPFKIVTFEKIKEEKIEPKDIKDKIIIIGMILENPPSSRHKDRHDTPYNSGGWFQEEMAGVEIVAHVTSQILSFALDERPLIRFLSPIEEWFWVLGFSLTGGMILLVYYRFSTNNKLIFIPIVIVGNIVIVYFFCLFLLMKGICLPVIPSLCALFLTDLALIFKKSSNRSIL